MAVRVIYVDESYDADMFCLSALSIRHTHWNESFALIREHRKMLRNTYGIPMHKEIHARDLVRGRGQISTTRDVTKWERSQIFLGMLKLATSLPNVQIFNICLPQKNIKPGLPDAHLKAWDRLINRIERTMKAFEQVEHPKRRKLIAKIVEAVDKFGEFLSKPELEELTLRLELYRARAIIFADEGRENEITKALRKMHVHNPIPSQFGTWQPSEVTKNITTERIIEDPTFKESSKSYFLQIVDCIAFALLKKEVVPTPNIKKYGIDKMFQVLEPACFKRASKRDPHGIVRK